MCKFLLAYFEQLYQVGLLQKKLHVSSFDDVNCLSQSQVISHLLSYKVFKLKKKLVFSLKYHKFIHSFKFISINTVHL